MTKFIKSLGLLVDVCICCSPLGYNKRRSWGKKRDLYLSGNFGNVCKEMVSNMNKAAQSGGTLSEQLGLNTAAACDSFLLAFPEHFTLKPVAISAMIWGHQGLLGSRLLALMIRIQKQLAVGYWGLFCLHLLAEDAQWQGCSQAGMAGAGIVFLSGTKAVHCSTVIAPGLQHCWVGIFLKELRSWRVSVHH